MNDDLREELRSEIEDFRTQTKRFLDKELNVKEFKGYSGGFGSYAQRGATSFMLRLRMNQGVMTKDKLKFICDTCKEHGVSRAHFTTCQTIQLHDLSGMEIPSIMSNALDHGIVCRGGGGDFPRNVMCSPLSGVDPQEAFDVLPYAARVGEYLLSMSCTGFEGGEHVVYHRLYDVANITVISNKNTVGVYDMEPDVAVRLSPAGEAAKQAESLSADEVAQEDLQV